MNWIVKLSIVNFLCEQLPNEVVQNYDKMLRDYLRCLLCAMTTD